MMKMVLATLICVVGLDVSSALAEQRGQALGRDSRIRTFTYYDDDVYRIQAATGYITTIFFAPGEAVVDVEAGDTALWQINTLTAGDRFSFKPINRTPQPTNITVHTDRRVYTLLVDGVTGKGPKSVGFRYNFIYPEDEKAETVRAAADIQTIRRAAGSNANLSYTAAGDEFLKPDIVFDDGAKTYIKMPSSTVRPAIFAMEADGRERLTNSSDAADGTIVVAGVYRQLVLRDGPYVTSLFNSPLYTKTEGRIGDRKSIKSRYSHVRERRYDR